MHTQKEAPPSGANSTTTPLHSIDESAASQGFRILEHLKKYGQLTTLVARHELGIMNPAQRISELRNKQGEPIDMVWVDQQDEAGVWHRVACYLWRGGEPPQLDLWEDD